MFSQMARKQWWWSSRKWRVLLVTAGIPGAVPVASGIATMFLHYAQILRHGGHDVSVLLTYGGSKDLQDAYMSKWGIQLHLLNKYRAPHSSYGTTEMKTSYNILQWMKDHEQSFDTAVFHDYRGQAFYPIHAKRAGLHFQNLKIVVTCHTSTRLAQFYGASETQSSDLVIYGMEDQTRANADVTVFPGKFMRDYVIEHATVDMSHMNAVVNANFLMIERQQAPQSAAGNQTVGRIHTNSLPSMDVWIA